MEKYELLYILPSKYTDAELGELVTKIGTTLSGLGAKDAETHNLGPRKLAYPIGHSRHGNYILVRFSAEPTDVPKMNDALRLSTDIIRHIILSQDPKLTAVPSFAEQEELMQQQRNPRRGMERKEEAASAKPAASAEQLDKKLDAAAAPEVK